MKKSTVILALVLGFLTVNGNALNNSFAFNNSTTVKTVSKSLCKAVATGDIDTVKLLIGNGAEVNVKSNGMLPIHYAAKYNRVDMIKVLITAGSEIHLPCDKGYTALALLKNLMLKTLNCSCADLKNKRDSLKFLDNYLS